MEVNFQYLGKILIAAGIIIIVVGVLLFFWDRIPYLGKLPGDVLIRKKNFTFYFPIISSIIISLLISLILYFLRK